MRRAACLAAAVSLVLVATFVFAPQVACAYEEPNTVSGAASGCMDCHDMHGGSMYPDGGDCTACHGEADGGAYAPGYEFEHYSGPHAGYATASTKCRNCHTVHGASTTGSILLPAATITATCFTCHDGTQGWGVYGAIAARGGSVGASHAASDTVNLIPGGDAATGGSVTRTFKGMAGNLVCTDCHSPHGANTVAAFSGERRRIRYTQPSVTSNRLLWKRPTGSTVAVGQYGSDWCMGCHAGRSSALTTMHNHPVDSLQTTTTPFTYDRVAILASSSRTSETTLAPLAGIPGDWAHVLSVPDPTGNRGFLMPYPRTAQQSGHAPICQQCHEDSRSVGTLSADGSAEASPTQIADADDVTWTGSAWVTSTADNPAFQNFPHETQNADMLVETGDNLCLNCHPTAQLP